MASRLGSLGSAKPQSRKASLNEWRFNTWQTKPILHVRDFVQAASQKVLVDVPAPDVWTKSPAFIATSVFLPPRARAQVLETLCPHC